MLLGGLTLIGWFFHLPQLTRAGQSFTPMSANAAVGFLLNGLAIISIAARRPKGALVGAAWSLLAGVVTLTEDGLGKDFGFDQILVADHITAPEAHPGRLAPTQPPPSFFAVWLWAWRHVPAPPLERRLLSPYPRSVFSVRS